MNDIHELNKRRALAWRAVQNVAMLNTPTDLEAQLELDCHSRLVQDAWVRAENEYSAALQALPTDTLLKIAGGDDA